MKLPENLTAHQMIEVCPDCLRHHLETLACLVVHAEKEGGVKVFRDTPTSMDQLRDEKSRTAVEQWVNNILNAAQHKNLDN